MGAECRGGTVQANRYLLEHFRKSTELTIRSALHTAHTQHENNACKTSLVIF